MEKYFYSEGYIYKGIDTICELFGTDIEKEEQGVLICKLLNNQIFSTDCKMLKQ